MTFRPGTRCTGISSGGTPKALPTGSTTHCAQRCAITLVVTRWPVPPLWMPSRSRVLTQFLRMALQIVRKPPGQRTFEVLPRRWVVERTLSWLVRCRRLDHDYERLPEHAEAMVKWTMIGLMTRRLAPAPGRRPWQDPKAA